MEAKQERILMLASQNIMKTGPFMDSTRSPVGFCNTVVLKCHGVCGNLPTADTRLLMRFIALLGVVRGVLAARGHVGTPIGMPMQLTTCA